jgi:hypothetical protein
MPLLRFGLRCQSYQSTPLCVAAKRRCNVHTTNPRSRRVKRYFSERHDQAGDQATGVQPYVRPPPRHSRARRPARGRLYTLPHPQFVSIPAAYPQHITIENAPRKNPGNPDPQGWFSEFRAGLVLRVFFNCGFVLGGLWLRGGAGSRMGCGVWSPPCLMVYSPGTTLGLCGRETR